VEAMKNETIRKLKNMRLPAFAEAYQKQVENETEYQSLSFHERLALLADAEYDSRHNNNIQRLIKNAKFTNSSAFLGNIEYLPDRHLNRDLLKSLADNEYIRQSLNVILIGATGCGKTYISNALGVNACQSGYKTRYIRLPELFSDFEAARVQGKYQQLMRQYQKYSLMILDEFLLIPTSDTEQRDLLELMESRCGQSSTIICSQFVPEGWHERLGGSALADSILDRIIPSAYTMIIDGDVSMRQRKQRITY
jgi:DNA replication protein DnaC